MTHSRQATNSRKTRSTSENKRQEDVLAHQREVLKIYVRLALEKAVEWPKLHSRSRATADAGDHEIAKNWLREVCCDKKLTHRRIRKKGEGQMIREALELLGSNREKLREETIWLFARRMLKIVPELPKLYKMALQTSKFSIKQVKYGEMETARAMAWHAYGTESPSPEILSRAYDLVEFECGRKVQSRPRKQNKRDRRKLRKSKLPPDSMDEIVAMSLVELADRAMYCVEDTILYSDQSTAVCQLDDFIAEITRCAIHQNSGLRDIVERCINKKMDKTQLIFKLERNDKLISTIWGDKERLKEWYHSVILLRRHGVTNLLLCIIHCDYGQFEVLGLQYTFGRGKFSEQHLQPMPRYRIAAMDLDKEFRKSYKNFKNTVFMKDGTLMKREPLLQRMLRLLFLIVYTIAAIVATVVVSVKAVKDGLVGYLEVASVVILGMIGTMVSMWQCLSSQMRPVRNAFRGWKEVHRIEDLLDVSYLRRHIKTFDEKHIDQFRKWLAGIGFGNNLPGIEVFFSGKDRYPVYDPKGIRVDDLSKVTLCDGYFLVRRPDEKAWQLRRQGENLRVEDVSEGHAVIVCESSRSRMRVGGGD